ncbi:MAG: mechanosensitive ion channel protein MscS [Betaproteobacteria bacterium]|jgi:small-conductance mechanosensitive channel|nr:mechanosensitive ion channel protein MscS [Betaproteobacteria bacterium]
METLRFYLGELARLNVSLFRLGDAEVTALALVKLVILLALLVALTRRLTRFIDRRLGLRPSFDSGTRLAVVRIVHYTLIIVGTMVILQTFGIKLTAFAVLAGAIGVGVGLGLQQIISNFISGLIIMFERPIKVGDRVELGTIEGNVTEIGMRRTTVVTSDNIAILVPNSRFIIDNVVNVGYHSVRVRVRLSVTVAPAADPAQVRQSLMDVAHAHPDVLTEPAPAVRLLALQAGGAMLFELQVWNANRIDSRDSLISDLNFAIREKLLAGGIGFA